MLDIVTDLGRPTTHIVTGFFTPNYRPLAETFSANLVQFAIPHHLFAVQQSDWKSATLLKPRIITKARNLYEDKIIAFMDVDCIVRGPVPRD